MKIAMLISTPFPPEEGIGNHVYNISKELIKRGHKVTVLTRGNSSKIQQDLFEKIPIYYIPYYPVYPFHVHIHKRLVEQFVRSHEFDIIHIHTPLSPPIKVDIPVVSTIHSSLIEDAKRLELVDLKSLGTKLMAKTVSYKLISDTIDTSKIALVVSNSLYNEILRYYSVNTPLIILKNGVDITKFIPPQTRTPGDTQEILYVGRLSYGKGLFDLLHVIRLLHENQYNIKVFLVGSGELENVLQALVTKYKLDQIVTFTGKLDRETLIYYYQRASIFVMPSYYETGPLVLLEAMACGLPVVSTPVGLATELLNGNNGVIVPPRDVRKMYHAITYLLNNPSIRKKLGKNARKTIEKHYSWPKVVDKLERIYQEVVE